jgi:hypothetical protein
MQHDNKQAYFLQAYKNACLACQWRMGDGGRNDSRSAPVSEVSRTKKPATTQDQNRIVREYAPQTFGDRLSLPLRPARAMQIQSECGGACAVSLRACHSAPAWVTTSLW